MSSDKIKSVSVSQANENNKTLNEKSSATNKSRNPLADLCENILPQKKAADVRSLRKSVSTVKKVQSKGVKVRSNSTSEVETKVNYYYKSENVTERQGLDDEEVFVKGEEHFINYVVEEKYSRVSSIKSKAEGVQEKITQSLPVVRITGTNAEKTEIKRPAQKINLVRRLSNRHKRCKVEELYANCYYDVDYFKDNYQYMLDMEKHFVLRKDILKKNADESYRMTVINWLLYVQQVLDLAEHTFFVGIRIFDYVLLSTKVSGNKYILVGVTCLWIANKYFDVHFIQVPKIFSICNGKFSRQQIITMEKEILKVLKFNVNFSEPASFLYYYLRRENLENDTKILHSAMFLLETFTFLLDFSSLRPSLLASMALYIVLDKYKMDCTSFLGFVESHLLDKERFVHKSEQMEYNVKQLLGCRLVSNEIVEKYSTEDRCCVARQFTYG